MVLASLRHLSLIQLDFMRAIYRDNVIMGVGVGVEVEVIIAVLLYSIVGPMSYVLYLRQCRQ